MPVHALIRVHHVEINFQNFELEQAGEGRQTSAEARSDPQLNEAHELADWCQVHEPAAIEDVEPGQQSRQRHEDRREQVSQGQRSQRGHGAQAVAARAIIVRIVEQQLVHTLEPRACARPPVDRLHRTKLEHTQLSTRQPILTVLIGPHIAGVGERGTEETQAREASEATTGAEQVVTCTSGCVHIQRGEARERGNHFAEGREDPVILDEDVKRPQIAQPRHESHRPCRAVTDSPHSEGLQRCEILDPDQCFQAAPKVQGSQVRHESDELEARHFVPEQDHEALDTGSGDSHGTSTAEQGRRGPTKAVVFREARGMHRRGEPDRYRHAWSERRR